MHQPVGRRLSHFVGVFLSGALLAGAAGAAPTGLPNPILFVTQVPVPEDYTTIGSVFGNQRPEVQSVARGGDLYILYPDGALRNLTREAGWGSDGFQGANSIAVRDPSVHWNGAKALFSMIVGSPVAQYEEAATHWQIYEVTGLQKGQPVSITKIARQPAGYNNVAPVYAPDGRIIFTTDRPRDGQAHLYPQLDEYEEAPTVSGLWSLDPATGDLRLLDHAPSGAFTPILDTAGRIVYTRWDHLQRDQQADSDVLDGSAYGTFNYASEAPDAARLNSRAEIYPEPRSSRTDLLAGTNLEGNEFNQFFPWAINPDGTEHETLNHVGRHEFSAYFDRSLNDNDALVEFIAEESGRFNPNSLTNDSVLQMKEDPRQPGRFLATDAPEFRSHAAGGIVAFNLAVDLAADQMRLNYLTAPVTAEVGNEGDALPAGASGHYRDPLPLANGQVLAVYTAESRPDANAGTRENPRSRYAFRLVRLQAAGAYSGAGAPLDAGISKSISFYDPDVLVSYSGPLWELQPVEVRSRPEPPLRQATLPAADRQIFTEEGVDPTAFSADLERRGLGVIVSHNVTTRDIADRQQPFNLQVRGGGAKTTADASRLYQVSHLQIFQADLIRGLGGATEPEPGRRVLAQTLHDLPLANPASDGPPGSVQIAADGSIAAFVPAHRALSWQLTDGAAATPVVRERYWLNVQPGEVRVCTSCHGPNSRDQASEAAPQNPPEALRTLLRTWKEQQPAGCSADATHLCLQGGRFRVETTWTANGRSGPGQAVALTADTGYFWFFNAANVEMVVKVLNGCPLLVPRYWVFAGGLTNVRVTMTVTDTQTAAAKTYTSLAGAAFQPIQDTSAFATCP